MASHRLLSAMLGWLWVLWAIPAEAQIEFLTPDAIEVSSHQKTPIQPLRRPYLPSANFVPVNVTVSTEGRVVFAEPDLQYALTHDLDWNLLPEAIDNARKAEFEPFTNNEGAPRPARFTVRVLMYIDERRQGDGISFPPVDGQDVTIRLERWSLCLTGCPEYVIELRSDGVVTYNGVRGVAVLGPKIERIAPQEVDNLLALFRAADFFSLQAMYHQGSISHGPGATLTLTVGDQTWQVWDYDGAGIGMPAVVAQLQAAVDRVARSDRWVTGLRDGDLPVNSEELPD